MNKVYDIVSSLIPDEQKDDIKSKIDGIVSDLIKDNSTNLKKELSGKYGVNFFEEDVTKAYDNKAFIKKETYEGEIKKYSELEAKYKELETTKLTLETNVKELSNFKTQSETSIMLLSMGFNPERLESVKPLISNELDAEKNVEKIKSGFPELFLKSNTFSYTNPQKKEEKPITEAEKYIQSQTKLLER